MALSAATHRELLICMLLALLAVLTFVAVLKALTLLNTSTRKPPSEHTTISTTAAPTAGECAPFARRLHRSEDRARRGKPSSPFRHVLGGFVIGSSNQLASPRLFTGTGFFVTGGSNTSVRRRTTLLAS